MWFDYLGKLLNDKSVISNGCNFFYPPITKNNTNSLTHGRIFTTAVMSSKTQSSLISAVLSYSDIIDFSAVHCVTPIPWNFCNRGRFKNCNVM